QLLKKQQVVEKYDSPGHFPLLFQYPHLYDHIQKYIKFGSANAKR
ncbi:2395_t:CDS:1, partial [Racocetra fulgida]